MQPLSHPALCAFLGEEGVAEMPMLQSVGLSVSGKCFCFETGQGLVLRLPAAEVERLTAAGQGMVFVTGRRTMRNWIVLAPSVPDRDLDQLLRTARDFTAAASGTGTSRRKASASR